MLREVFLEEVFPSIREKEEPQNTEPRERSWSISLHDYIILREVKDRAGNKGRKQRRDNPRSFVAGKGRISPEEVKRSCDFPSN